MPVMVWMIGLMIIKLLLFVIFSLAGTSWRDMTTVVPYVRVILLSFILSIPIGMFRCRWMQIMIFVGMDAVLLCESAAQFEFVRWLLPGSRIEMVNIPACGASLILVTTLAAIILALKYREQRSVPFPGKIQYCGYLIVWLIIAWLTA